LIQAPVVLVLIGYVLGLLKIGPITNFYAEIGLLGCVKIFGTCYRWH